MIENAMSYLEGHTWIVEMFAIVLGTALVHYFVKLLLGRLTKQFEKTHNVWDDAFITAAKRPIAWGVWIVGISWAAESAGGEAQAEIFSFIGPIREVAVVAMLVWFAIRFISNVEDNVTNPEYREEPVDPTTATAVGKLLRASILITGALMVLQGLGFSVSGVLAFGGIGGIAIGFAARDILANFFGALMIFMDRPFAVGDWIRSPAQEIEGTVEEIGWRLTRIRTFDQRPLYVPNAIFTSLVVENPSRMLNRRIYETIGVRYDDVGVLPNIVSDVEKMLRDHVEIDVNRTLMVNFVEFGPSSLDFFVYTFTKTTVWAEYHRIKQDVLFRISEIITGHGAEIAFPTQTVQLESSGA